MSVIFLLLGLIIGSFLNVCIYRIPENKSIVNPPSHCPKCNTQLKPKDLIPLVSYLIKGGKCSYCGCRISAQYPLVELTNGLLYLLVCLKFGGSIQSVLMCMLLSLIIVISMIDIKYSLIPDELNLAGLVLAVLMVAANCSWSSLVNHMIGLLLGGGLFLLIAVVTNGAMGGGDIKMMGFLGLWFGWKLILLVSILSFVIGAVFSILLIMTKIKKMKDYIPFGPFIGLAVIITCFYGNQILAWYIHLL